MKREVVEELHSRSDTQTEEAMMFKGKNRELFDGEGTIKTNTSIGLTFTKQKEVFDVISGGVKDEESAPWSASSDNSEPMPGESYESDEKLLWNRDSDVNFLHYHPVKNGIVNLHPSAADLDAWKSQHELFWIEDQWIVWFDTTSNPTVMWRVLYHRDGSLKSHKLHGESVKVSKVTHDGKWKGYTKDIVLEDTWHLQTLEEKEQEEASREAKIISLKDQFLKNAA